MRKFSKILNIVGSILILVSLAILFFTFGPVAKEEIKYRVSEVMDVKYSLYPQAETKEKKLTPPNTDFSIVIPKIAAVAPVFANIDPQDKNVYLPVLQKGVAHAQGTAYPGEPGNVYLFAHSTDAFYNVGRYNAVFYLLGKLEKGDEIDVFYKGQRIKYSVDYVKVVAPEAIEYLGKIGESNTLTLQTCYPPGTTLKRLVVVANQVNY